MKTWILAAFFSTVLVSSLSEAGSYTDVKKFIKDIADKYPQTSSVFDLGLSDSGEMIQGLRIGDGAVKQMVVATHHGNEYGSTEVAKGFAAYLAANPLPQYTVYVIPVLNISGYNNNERRESLGGETYDPNRDYPGPCGTSGPFKLKSTAALARFVDTENIVASATLHTFFPAVVYPWGLSSNDLNTPYDGIFKQLVQAATMESGYQVGNSTEVIYPADGTYEDYAFWKHGIWSILFELGNSHTPSDDDVNQMIKVNTPGLVRMLAAAPTLRASDHDFKGKCNSALKALDLREE